MIRSGAKLVIEAEDILSELEAIAVVKRKPRQTKLDFDLTSDEQTIMTLLNTEPMHIDDIAEKCAFTTSQALATLLGLELRSIIRQLPGKMFISLA